ncbi:MAG: glycosyltransferase family A protein [Chitinophagaceae bacterium]
MSTGEPLVSVLMTAYNREKYIGEAIESVLASTYSHFELIIVDDGSKDATVTIAREYAGSDARINVYVNEKNLGDYHNRNHAATYASGKYIKYLDSDDLIYPDSLSVFVRSMEKFPEAAVGIMSNIGQDAKPYPYLMEPAAAYHYHFYTRGLFDTGPSALIFNADKFRAIGGFSGKRYVGDTEINLRLAARWPLVKISSSLVYWRQHEGQEIVAGNTSTGYLELQLPMFTEELNKKECPLPESERKNILSYFRRMSAMAILKMAILQKKPRQAMDMYRQLSLTLPDMVSAVLQRKKRY